MKILLFGANGTIGKHISRELQDSGHELIKVGRSGGDFRANIEDAESLATLFKKIGSFDAIANASGEVAFEVVPKIKKENWDLSFRSKLRGQINLVEQALPYINANGSFTLVSGILGEEHIGGGAIAATVNSAVEAYAKAAALELPKNLRINVVSPTVLEDSLKIYGDFFPGFRPTDGRSVAMAYKKSILGIQTGKVFKVY